MKKILKSVWIFLLIFLAVGCTNISGGNQTDNPDNKEYVTITFLTNGGTEIEPLTIEKGSIPVAPLNPTKEGYEFEGWMFFGTQYDFTSVLATDITLTAQWKKINNNEDSEYHDVVIYSINDFHGALNQTNGEYGISRIAAFLKNEMAKEYQTTIVLSAGDMFQGTGISNYKYGLDVINIMNYIGFDSMTLGNHEFDWSLDKILEYQDGSTDNGEANFPFLGCNVFEKDSNQLPTNVDPYVIFEKNEYRFAVVGYIGYGLEGDIATSMIEDYYFDDPVKCVSETVEEIRSNNLADFVIAVGHDGSSATNNQLANLKGNEKVDAIINGHTHNDYYELINTSDNSVVPLVQAGTAGKYLGKITLKINKSTLDINNATANVISMQSGPLDAYVEEYLAKANAEVSPYFDRIIGVAGNDLNSKYDITDWAVNTIKTVTNADIAFTNLGGLRANAFPIRKDENITVAKLYEIMPFDNAVKTVTMKGSDILLMMQVNGFIYTYLDVDPNLEYRVAAIDYIFDNNSYLFNKGTDIEITGLLFRDIMIADIEKITEKGLKWME